MKITRYEAINNHPLFIGESIKIDLNSHNLFEKMEKSEKVLPVLNEKNLDQIAQNSFIIENISVKFTDDVWNFTDAMPETSFNKDIYKYNFTSIRNNVSDYYLCLIKLYVLNELLEEGLHRPYLKYNYSYLCAFLSFLYNEHIFEIEDSSLYHLHKFLKEKENTVSPKTISAYKTALKSFYEFYGYLTDTKADEEIINELERKNKKAIKEQAKTSKYKLPPYEYMKKLKDSIFNDFWDENKFRVSQKRILGLLYINLETGLRPSEIINLETDCIKEINVGQQPISYMKYRSTKNVYGKGTTTWTTYANAKIKQIYDRLVTLLPNEKCSKLSEGITYYDYSGFFYDYCTVNAERFDALTDEPIENLQKHVMVSTNDGKAKIANMPYLKQFRVYVSTELKERGKSSFAIAELLSHKDPQMLDYYSRPAIETEKDIGYAKAVLTDIVSDDLKIIGPKGDVYKDRINQFLSEGNLQHKTIDEVVDTIAKELPIKEILGGCCISPSPNRPCEIDNGLKADKLLCAYGMCRNQNHLYWHCAYQYAQFKEAQTVIRHNKKEGYERQAEKELNKLQTIIVNLLIPELTELEAEVIKQGKEAIISKHSIVEPIIENISKIKTEVEKWKKIKLSQV